MNKKDFIRLGIMAHLLVNPEKRSPKEAAKWTADIWDMTEDAGIAVMSRKKTNKKVSFYEQLRTSNTQWFDYFCKFWTLWWNEKSATSDSRGRDQAAEQWLILCRKVKPAAEWFDHVIYAAGVYAKFRPGIVADGLKPIMAYRWLKLNRYDDVPPAKELKANTKVDSHLNKIRDLKAQIHQTIEAQKTGSVEFWQSEKVRLEAELETLIKGNAQ